MTSFMDKLIQQFEKTFRGKVYKHRVSNTGDIIASYLYEDLFDLAESTRFNQRVNDHSIVINTNNQIKGKKGRRGDGTLGRLIPGEDFYKIPSFFLARGPIANLQIGTEVKIIATKMIAQIDRVMTDIINQSKTFKNYTSNSICVGIVGVNHASTYEGHEGDRTFITKKPPAQEATEVIRRIEARVKPEFDELLIFRFRATNIPPFYFDWVDAVQVRQDYKSALVRICNLYEDRFR